MVPFGMRYPEIVISLLTDRGIPDGATGRNRIVSDTQAFSSGMLSICSKSISPPSVHAESSNFCKSF